MVGHGAAVAHEVRYDVVAEIMRGAGQAGVAPQRVYQELRVEHVDAHAGQASAGLARDGRRVGRLFQKGGDPVGLVHRHHAEA